MLRKNNQDTFAMVIQDHQLNMLTFLYLEYRWLFNNELSNKIQEETFRST